MARANYKEGDRQKQLTIFDHFAVIGNQLAEMAEGYEGDSIEGQLLDQAVLDTDTAKQRVREMLS